jgi:hypothetical protein
MIRVANDRDLGALAALNAEVQALHRDAMPARSITLDVQRFNAGARGFYDALGYGVVTTSSASPSDTIVDHA